MTFSSSIRQMHVFMWMNCLTMLVFAFINISKFIRWKYISGAWQDTMKHWKHEYMVNWCIFWTLTHNGTSQQFSFEEIFGEICNFCPLCAMKWTKLICTRRKSQIQNSQRAWNIICAQWIFWIGIWWIWYM